MPYNRVYVEITNICNRKCSFCPGTVRKPRRMTMEEFTQIVDKLQGITKYIYLHVMGEPLTHPMLPDFIKYARGKGFKVAITTNGTLLSQRKEELFKAKPYKINISIHSFEESSREAYLDYINQCMEFADASSQNDILTVFRLWNQGFDKGRNIDTLGLLREYFKPCDPSCAGEEAVDMDCTYPPYNEWNAGSRGFRIRGKLHLEYGERFAWPDMQAEEGDGGVFCYGLKDHFGILCDGRVIPCCLDREGEITLGNIFEEHINEILSSERATRIAEGFRNRKAVEELCRKCGYARRF